MYVASVGIEGSNNFQPEDASPTFGNVRLLFRAAGRQVEIQTGYIPILEAG
jgi:hypothetical protein